MEFAVDEDTKYVITAMAPAACMNGVRVFAERKCRVILNFSFHVDLGQGHVSKRTAIVLQ